MAGYHPGPVTPSVADGVPLRRVERRSVAWNCRLNPSSAGKWQASYAKRVTLAAKVL